MSLPRKAMHNGAEFPRHFQVGETEATGSSWGDEML